jgi:hypothetical protein
MTVIKVRGGEMLVEVFILEMMLKDGQMTDNYIRIIFSK